MRSREASSEGASVAVAASLCVVGPAGSGRSTIADVLNRYAMVRGFAELGENGVRVIDGAVERLSALRVSPQAFGIFVFTGTGAGEGEEALQKAVESAVSLKRRDHIDRLAVIVNRMTDGRLATRAFLALQRELMRCGHFDLEYLGNVPEDEKISEALSDSDFLINSKSWSDGISSTLWIRHMELLARKAFARVPVASETLGQNARSIAKERGEVSL